MILFNRLIMTANIIHYALFNFFNQEVALKYVGNSLLRPLHCL